MPFIRHRRTARGSSHQLMETYREGGKVKQRVLANLGRHPTLEEALLNARERVVELERRLVGIEQRRHPRGGSRYYKSWQKQIADARQRLEDGEAHLQKLEAVVSQNFPTAGRSLTLHPPEAAETGPSGNRLNTAQAAPKLTALADNGLSGLQNAILRLALEHRGEDTRGVDVSRAEILVEVWGWEPHRRLRLPTGGIAPSGRTKFDTATIGAKEYRSAQASLSRALTRLYKRDLITFHGGDGNVGSGIALSHAGWLMAQRLAYPVARQVDDDEAVQHAGQDVAEASGMSELLSAVR